MLLVYDFVLPRIILKDIATSADIHIHNLYKPKLFSQENQEKIDVLIYTYQENF